jgi:hypothetical protein
MSDEKRGLEIGAISQFSDLFASEIGSDRFVFDRLLDPPMPDALCSLNGQPVYVEIAHSYGTEADARLLLGRKGKLAPTSEERRKSAMVPLDNRLLTPLNYVLARKAAKDYAVPRVWLLVRSAFPIWDVTDFMEYQAHIRVPNGHPFEQVWLLCGPRVSFGALQIA